MASKTENRQGANDRSSRGKASSREAKSDRLTRRVLAQFRTLAAETEPGVSMGSEESLIKKFNVSRPTFRSAAAILSREQLVTIKRGPGGGYFARRPDSSAVSHTAAVLLHSRKTDLSEVVAAIPPVFMEMVSLAVRNQSEQVRRDWETYLRADEVRQQAFSLSDLSVSEREFARLLGKASENRVLELFLSILYDFCVSIQEGEVRFEEDADRIREQWGYRHRLVQALIDHDADVSDLYARRLNTMTVDWMTESMRRKKAGSRSASVIDALV